MTRKALPRRVIKKEEGLSDKERTVHKKSDDTLQDGGATMWQNEVNKKLDSLLTIVPLVEELREELKKIKEEENIKYESRCSGQTTRSKL